MQAWQFLKVYLKEKQDALVYRFLNGDVISEADRYKIVGLVELFNHIEDAVKRYTETTEANS